MSTIFDTYPEPVVQAALIQPVLCVDCQQYVPLGWIDQVGGVFVACPTPDLNRGHRASNDALTSILDATANRLAA